MLICAEHFEHPFFSGFVELVLLHFLGPVNVPLQIHVISCLEL